MNRKVRKLIIYHRMHQPRAYTGRLKVKGENYGRLIILELTYKTTTIGLKIYLSTTTDWILQLVNIHEKKYSIRKESNKFAYIFDFAPKEISIND